MVIVAYVYTVQFQVIVKERYPSLASRGVERLLLAC